MRFSCGDKIILTYGEFMDTKIINYYEDKQGFKECIDTIKSGGVVVFPTETVYGIGANALNSKAVSKIFDVKGRAKDNPLIIHVCDFDISEYVEEVNDDTKKLINAFWPGPLTIILKKKPIIPDETTAGRDTVAIRMPNNEIALKLISESGYPIAAPSANISGKPSGTNVERCFEDLKGKVKFIVNGYESEIGIESTVISMVNKDPVILRPGYITIEDIKKILPNVTLYSKLNEKNAVENPISPGLKYKHYAPNCQMVILKRNKEHIMEYVKKVSLNYNKIGILCVDEHLEFYGKMDMDISIISVGSSNNFKQIGKNLFESIRKFDDMECDFIVSECFFDDFSNGVMNRLLRAASYNVIE